MSRLIDADALIAKQASIAKTFAHSDAQKSLMGRVIYNTEKAPAIDAIPVEWLKEHDGVDIRDSDGNIYGRRRITVLEALLIWQKEQEAR